MTTMVQFVFSKNLVTYFHALYTKIQPSVPCHFFTSLPVEVKPENIFAINGIILLSI